MLINGLSVMRDNRCKPSSQFHEECMLNYNFIMIKFQQDFFFRKSRFIGKIDNLTRFIARLLFR